MRAYRVAYFWTEAEKNISNQGVPDNPYKFDNFRINFGLIRTVS